MAGFSDDEITAAVSRFVKTDIEIERDELGPVSQDSKYGEVVQLISSTLIFDPNAIFYVIFLATNRLNTKVEDAIELVDDIIDAIGEVNPRTTEVTRTTLLGDAQAALLEVDAILSERDALSNPAFTRYTAAVDAFVDASLAPNIKSSGQIIRPPQKARPAARTALASLQDAYEEILEIEAQIRVMLSEFNDLNLPVLTIQDSVRKARKDLDELQDTFEDASTTRDDKIAETRDAYLRITAGRAVLANYTTVKDPEDPRLESNASLVGRAAVPTSDGEYTQAEVTCTKSAPWAIETGTNDELKIAEDGLSETTYTIVPPALASVTGYATETFAIVAATNDKLEIDKLSPRVTLTAGGARTAAQVAADINTWATTNSYPYLASDVSGQVKIEKTDTGAQRIKMTADDVGDRAAILAAYTTLGFYEGQDDTSEGVTAAELAEQLNDADKVEAEVVRALFEEDDNGEVISTTVFRLPLNTLSTLSHTDDMLLIRSGDSVGYHRIASVARATFDEITVVPTQPLGPNETDVDYLILREVVLIRSKVLTLAGQLVVGTGNANSTLGFSAGTTKSQTTGYRAAKSGVDQDFTRSGVVEGDALRRTVGPTVTNHNIDVISSDGKQLEVSPPVDVDVSSDTFKILSAAAIAHEAFVAALDSWDDFREAGNFSEDIGELERVMNPLLANNRPSAAQIGDATTSANELRDLLTNASPLGLSEVLEGFAVIMIPRIDAALKMLVERGLDRAYDTLLDGRVAEFFGYDKDDAASSSFMLKSMRDVVVEDLPQSKLDDDVDDIRHDELVINSNADLDFSDVDDEDEDVAPLGEIPDLEDVDEDILRQRL